MEQVTTHLIWVLPVKFLNLLQSVVKLCKFIWPGNGTEFFLTQAVSSWTATEGREGKTRVTLTQP